MADDTCQLAAKKCTPCEGGTEPLKGEQLRKMTQCVEGWELVEDKMITKIFKFPDFKSAWKFTDRIAQTAEEQGHHPDIYLGWGKVRVTLTTHNIGGLSENDFILAAQVDQLGRE